MKFIIDLIEAIREEIQNQTDFTLLAMLLKENEENDLVFAGEAPINSVSIGDEILSLKISSNGENVSTKSLLETVNALSNEEMMYPIIIEVMGQRMKLLGFGSDIKAKKFVFFLQK